MNRIEIADHIVAKLFKARERLGHEWAESGNISHVYIDDVLPIRMAEKIRMAYPDSHTMRTRRSLRELKHVAAQMDQYDPVLEEALFAFQDKRVVGLIQEITGLRELKPDELLYAGGISMMSNGHFLNPHIDNSHDKSRTMYRVLNLLYYVSPNWRFENGGNLELWPQGVKGKQTIIESRFNRLVVMITNRTSLHSVSPVQADDLRCCVSNYYFSQFPAEGQNYFHITSFRGRPEQPVRDLVLQVDAALRGLVRKVFPKGAVQTTHYYDKSKSTVQTDGDER
jgi:Rps23 Pro-64 3,4-dihydroxylase Tpa1-like proline 4-hydroxylase